MYCWKFNTHILDYVIPKNVSNYEYYNMTLRNPNAKFPDWDSLLSRYNSNLTLKDYAIENYHVETIVNQLLSK